MSHSFRGKNIPYLLMTDTQKADTKQLSYDGYVTRNFDFCDLAKPAFEEIIKDNRNRFVVQSVVQNVDYILGQFKIQDELKNGFSGPLYNYVLAVIKRVHDDLMKIGHLQDFEKILEKYLDHSKSLHDRWTVEMSPTAVKLAAPDQFSNTDKQPIPEGTDYRMSKAYYDKDSKKWIQRKVRNVDIEKEKTVQKQANAMFREGMQFRKFINEDDSELNVAQRLQSDGDIKKDKEDGIYNKNKKTKQSFKTKKVVNVIDDPMSS